MRRDGDAGVLPERVARRQRLGTEHIQRGTRHMAAVNGGKQILVHQMRSARHVDDIGAGLQPGQRVLVDHVGGVGCEGQQIDQHTACGQKIVELIRPRKRAHTLDGLGAAAPAVDRKVKLRQRLGHTLAQNTQAHHADGVVAAQARLAVAPAPSGRVGLVAVQLAEVTDDGVAHIFGHLHGHARIVQPHHQGLGRQAQLEQGIHPRTDVEQCLERGLLVHELLGRGPDDGVVGLGSAGLPHRNLSAGQRGGKALEPGLGLGVSTAKGDFHGPRA